MNAPASLQGNHPRRGLHPLVAVASVCVIALCAVAIAAILGWLPTPSAQEGGARNAAAAVPPEEANLAPLPQDHAAGTFAAMGANPAAASGAGQNTAPPAAGPGAQPPNTVQAQPSAQSQARYPAQSQARVPQQQASAQASGQAPMAQQPQSVSPAQAAACPQCGVVVSVNTVQVPVQNNSEPIIGTVAGGVVGGVVGNQFGGGNGKTALTVLGAVGGALAGREIERNIKQQQTVTRYRLVARTNDGRTHTFNSATPFQYAPGQAIRVENNQLLPQ